MYPSFGIPIAEYKLLGIAIIYTVLLLALLGSMLFLLSRSYEKPNPKKAARRKKLQKKIESYNHAQKQLKRMERKQRNRRKRAKDDRAFTTVVCTLAVCLMLATLILLIVPSWTDYIEKDYIVYIGDFRVEHPSQKRSYIYLTDGTKLTGSGGLPEGFENGTVVYSKRTRLVLGAEP